jgi:hypothetical protein
VENVAIIRSGQQAFGVAAPCRGAKTVMGCFGESLQQLEELHVEPDELTARDAEWVLALGATPWLLRARRGRCSRRLTNSAERRARTGYPRSPHVDTSRRGSRA